MAKGSKMTPDDVAAIKTYQNTTVMNIRMRDGDIETINWLCENLGMSRSDVIRRALTAYAAQVVAMRK